MRGFMSYDVTWPTKEKKQKMLKSLRIHHKKLKDMVYFRKSCSQLSFMMSQGSPGLHNGPKWSQMVPNGPKWSVYDT